MKALNKQSGYTLIITLVLIVLILMFTATFSVASMNQAKQVERTDESYVALSMAEMGTEFVTNKINRIIITQQSSLIADINLISKNLPAADYNSAIQSKISSRKRETATQIINYLRNLEDSIDGNTYYTASKKRTNYNSTNEIDNLILTNTYNETIFGVSSTNGGNAKKSIDITINIPENIGINYAISSVPTGTPTYITSYKNFKCNVNFTCNSSDVTFSNNTPTFTNNLYYKGSITFNKLDPPKNKKPADLNGITVYSEKGILITHNQGYVYNSKLVTNELSFTSPSASMKTYFNNSFIYANSIKISKVNNKTVNLDNSTLCLADSKWEESGNYNLINNSKIYVLNPAKSSQSSNTSSIRYLSKENFETLCNAVVTVENSNNSQNVNLNYVPYSAISDITYN